MRLGALLVLVAIATGCERGRCVDTVTIISAMPTARHEAMCDSDQTMRIEDRVQGALVVCTCKATP